MGRRRQRAHEGPCMDPLSVARDPECGCPSCRERRKEYDQSRWRNRAGRPWYPPVECGPGEPPDPVVVARLVDGRPVEHEVLACELAEAVRVGLAERRIPVHALAQVLGRDATTVRRIATRMGLLP